MGQYGRAAVSAYRAIIHDNITPINAWNTAIANETNSPTSQDKPCPRNTFLGLCNRGLLAGIHEVHPHPHSWNADYAETAVRILQANPRMAADKSGLWEQVMAQFDPGKGHSQQMDIVVALWEIGAIVPNE